MPAPDGRSEAAPLGATPSQSLELPRWSYAALPIVLGVAAAAVLVSALLVLAFGWEIYPGEAINSYFASRFVHGGPLYRDWTALTPYFPIYPPGFYWLAAPLELLDASAIWPGRLLSLVAMLFAAWAAWRIAIRLGCQPLEAAASSVAFLSIGATNQLIAAARPDGIALGFMAAALLAATRWEDRRDRGALTAATVLTAAFVIVKYNFAPLALAIAVAFWVRDRRSAVIYVVGSAALTLAAFVVADIASTGAFISNTRDFSTGYAFGAFRDVVKPTLEPFPNPLLVVAALEATVALAARPFLTARIRAVHLAWFASLIVILSAVKIGSAGNYVAPTALASSILIGPALMRLRVTLGRSAAAVASIALALLLLPATYELVRGVPDLRSDLASLEDDNNAAVDRIAAAPGLAFGDRPDLTIEADKGPSFDSAPMTLLWQSGKWDTGPLVQLIRARRVGIVQSSFDLAGTVPTQNGTPAWPLDIVEAVRSAYCVSWTTGSGSPASLWLYEPCPSPPG